jgi:hypothetical protein
MHPITGPAAERRVVNDEILEGLIARIEHAVAYAAIELGGQHRLIAQLVQLDNGLAKLSTEEIAVGNVDIRMSVVTQFSGHDRVRNKLPWTGRNC